MRKARSRHRTSSSASTPRTPDGNEADSEDGRTTPRSTGYGAINRNKPTVRQRSQAHRAESQSQNNDLEGVAAGVNSTPVTSGSDDSSTPIVPPSKPRGRKSTFRENPQLHIRQVFDSLRYPGRKSTFDSLEGESLAKNNSSEFDEAELDFLTWLDGEIKKIDEFYQEKEYDAAQRYKLLAAQLEALRQLREQQRITESNGSSQSASRAEPNDERNTFQKSWVQKPIGRIRASLDGLTSAMPTADHERRAGQPELMAHPITSSTGYVEYRVAKRRLKEAVLEFYRGMELLKGYRLLNRTGLAKILKKFDKTTGRKISPEYTEKLKAVHFDQSEELEHIMDRTEVYSHILPSRLTSGFICSVF